jgi:hypothetical protein
MMLIVFTLVPCVAGHQTAVLRNKRLFELQKQQ